MSIENITLRKSAHALCCVLSVTGSDLLTAQNTCADLTILSVRYAAFNDSVIEVVAQAAEGSFFSYPSFSLVDAMSDTLTREQVNFFGVGQWPQTHSSMLIAGQTLPASPFTGTVLFTYSGPDEENFCTFPISSPLCPPAPCVDIQVYVSRIANPPMVTTSFSWTVTDEWDATVGTGIGMIDAMNGQLALSDLCLPPGNYTLDMQQDDVIGDLFNFGVTQRNFSVEGPHTALLPGGSASLLFTLYAPCFTGGNDIIEEVSTAPTLMLNDRSLTLLLANGGALGSIEILDATGRCVRRGNSASSSATFDLDDLACGMHIVRTATGPSIWKAQRIILH